MDRLGAIGDIRFTIERAGLGDDYIFVVAGDNLIGYDLRDYVRFWRDQGGSAIALRHEPDAELIKQYGAETVKRGGLDTKGGNIGTITRGGFGKAGKGGSGG